MPLLHSSQDRSDLGVSKGTSKASAPRGSGPSVAVVSQSSCPVPSGVPQITTWTTPQRCCGSGWLLWAATTRLSSGSLKRPGDPRARALETIESSCYQCQPVPRTGCPLPCRGERLTFCPLPRPYPDEQSPKHWTRERHQFVMELKQEALTFARAWGADYILVRRPPGLGLGRSGRDW